MIIVWIVAGTFLLLIVVLSVHDQVNRARARKILPEVLGRDWIEGRDLRKLLKGRGASLSYGGLYLFMRDQSDFAEHRDVYKICDGQSLKIREFRRRFAARIPSDAGESTHSGTAGIIKSGRGEM